MLVCPSHTKNYTEFSNDNMIQQSSMEMAQWREIVAERRRMQNTENSRKMEEMKQSLRQSQQQLEHRIRQKEERAANLRYAVEERKV